MLIFGIFREKKCLYWTSALSHLWNWLYIWIVLGELHNLDLCYYLFLLNMLLLLAIKCSNCFCYRICYCWSILTWAILLRENWWPALLMNNTPRRKPWWKLDTYFKFVVLESSCCFQGCCWAFFVYYFNIGVSYDIAISGLLSSF